MILSLLLTCVPNSQIGGGWEVTQSYFGSDSLARFTSGFSSAGDVDLDGCMDFVIGGASDLHGFHPSPIRVISGRTGADIRVLTSSLGSTVGVSFAPAGDLNHDGWPDLLAAAAGSSPGNVSRAGGVVVFSGRDGSELLVVPGTQASEYFGRSVDGGGDGNGDGTHDLLVGTRGDGGGSNRYGHCQVLSGVDGSVLLRVDGTRENAPFARVVAWVGDWDADGRDDFAVSDSDADTIHGEDSGMVWIHSGATGLLLDVILGESANDAFGFDFANTGDVDGDGRDDLIIGAPGHPGIGFVEAGAAYVFSGGTGAQLHFIPGAHRGGWLGYSVSGAGKQDRDSNADFLIAEPLRRVGSMPEAGMVHLYSGGDCSWIRSFWGRQTYGRFGSNVGIAGDLDGDGTAHLFLHHPDLSTSGYDNNGAVYVVAYEPYLTVLPTSISAALGGELILNLDFPDLAAGMPYQVLVSSTGAGPTTLWGVQVPLTRDAAFWRSLGGQLPPYASGFQGVLGPHGDTGARLAVGPGAVPLGWIGRSFWLAAVVRTWTGAGVLSSMARPVVVLP